MTTVLDWSDSCHWSPRRRPCAHCGAMTNLRNAAGRAAHKVCVERLINHRRHLRAIPKAALMDTLDGLDTNT